MDENILIHYNHNHDRLGRFARSTGSAASSVGGKVTGKSKKKQPPKADVKKGKQANTKLSEKDRNRIVNSGTAKDVAKYKDRLSTRELETAVNRLQKEKLQRIDLERKLSDLSTNPESRKNAMDKIENIANNMDRLSTSVEKAARMYNTAAKVHNVLSAPSDAWPLYGEKKTDKKHKTSEEIRNLINTGSREEIYKRRGEMTTQEYNEATKRRKNDDENRKALADNRAALAKSIADRAERDRQRPINENKYRTDLAKSELDRRTAEKNLRDFNKKEASTKQTSKPTYYTSKPSKSSNESSKSSSSSTKKKANKPTYAYNNNTKAAQNYVQNNYDTMLSSVVSNGGVNEYASEVEKRKIKYVR